MIIDSSSIGPLRTLFKVKEDNSSTCEMTVNRVERMEIINFQGISTVPILQKY